MSDLETALRDLTYAQASLIARQGRFGRMPLSACQMRPLVRRGYFERVERKGFQTRWELTELGRAIRDHLVS